MNGLGKTSSKKSVQNLFFKKKKRKIYVKKPHVNKKPLARILVQTKTRPIMNYEWIAKTIQKKNPINKIEKQ